MRARNLLLVGLSLALAGAAAAAEPADSVLLAPRLSRRLAIEDEPLVLEVRLPDGVPLDGRPDGPRVGGVGLLYDYHWRLMDAGGEVLRERQERTRELEDRWVTVLFVEPYEVRFEGKLAVDVEVTYLLEDGRPLAKAAARFSIPRIQDVTPPLSKSGGDEEAYADFVCRSLTVPDGGVATTTDTLVDGEGQVLSRSPFQAIRDDGATVEGDPEDLASRGTLEFEWANVFDNLAPPFDGSERPALGRFALYLLPNWDLGGSHHLVSGTASPHMRTRREVVREEGEGLELHLVDLGDQLGEGPPQGGSWGRGRVRIPLPYDRVGDLEVGFYAEDRAWPSPNHARVGRFRLRIEDDIAPTALFSIRKVRQHDVSWITADSVNRRWHDAELVFGMPEAFGGPPLERLAALAVRVQTPYHFQAMVFENTRLARDGLRVTLEGPEGAVGHGMRIPGRAGRHTTWRLPVDGFDPSLSRTPRDEAGQLFFGVPGRYRLVLEATDVHGNTTRFEVGLQAEERPGDWIQVSEETVRISGERERP